MALGEVVYKERDIALDIIKIVATVFVIKLHSGESGLFSEVFHYICGAAIPLFLMVSGALILNKDSIDFKYAGKKILNVLVIMALWCVLLMTGKFVMTRVFENPLKYAFGAMRQQGMLSHFWYLWTLVIMYLISPILSRLSKSRGGTAWTTLVLLTLCAIMSCSTLLYGKAGIEVKTLQFLRVWTNAMYFWCGGMAYKIAGEVRQNKTIEDITGNYRSIIVAVIIIIAIAMAMIQFKVLERVISIHSPEYLFSNPIVVIYNTVLFMALVTIIPAKFSKEDGRAPRILLQLSKDSFGVYVLHMFVIVALGKVMPGVHWALRFVIVTFVSFAASNTLGRIPYVKRLIQFG